MSLIKTRYNGKEITGLFWYDVIDLMEMNLITFNVEIKLRSFFSECSDEAADLLLSHSWIYLILKECSLPFSVVMFFCCFLIF